MHLPQIFILMFILVLMISQCGDGIYIKEPNKDVCLKRRNKPSKCPYPLFSKNVSITESIF